MSGTEGHDFVPVAGTDDQQCSNCEMWTSSWKGEPCERALIHLDMGLRNFSEEPSCVKCSSQSIETVFHPMPVFHAERTTPCEEWLTAMLLTSVVREHLCRRCRSCGYGWPEQTADA